MHHFENGVHGCDDVDGLDQRLSQMAGYGVRSKQNHRSIRQSTGFIIMTTPSAKWFGRWAVKNKQRRSIKKRLILLAFLVKSVVEGTKVSSIP
jgi:hypothetical protein